ncbi:MAG: radical SAM protein [archaeon]
MNEKKKVVLMYPNPKWAEFMERTSWIMHPYNLCLIAAMVEKDYDVKIIDANLDNLSVEDFSESIRNMQPDIVGISTITNEYTASALIAAKTIKETSPNTKVVLGGVSVISDHKPFIQSPYVDCVVVGEGEYAFKQLCDFLSEKGNFPERGVLYKEHGQIRGGGRVDFIEDLDALPLPAYHLVDLTKYTNQIQRESVDRPRAMPYARVLTSRGCPYGCCFCEVESISGKKIRFRSLKSITEEIEWLIRDYGIKALSFDDDNLTANRERAKELFRIMIDRKYNLKWYNSAVGLFTLDDEILDLMKESGCQFLGVAIESGNQRVLKDIIHKPIDLVQAKEMIEKIKQRGIDLSVNFIIGFPGETWEEIRETIKFAEEIDVDYAKIFIATPLPNTELYRITKEGGYLKEGFEFNKHLWTDGWIKSSEFRPQDLKVLRAYEWDRINFSSPEKRKNIARMMGISEERLDEIRKDTLKRANP